MRGKRATVSVLALTAGMVGAEVATAPPAMADVTTPSGCEIVPRPQNSWANTCWLSSNPNAHDRYGYTTVGVQQVLTALNYKPGAIDGEFGTSTTSATQTYQTDYGLTSDGIVGTNTWQSMRNRLSFTSTVNQYYYYVVGGSASYWRWNSNAGLSYGLWETRCAGTGTAWNYMTTAYEYC